MSLPWLLPEVDPSEKLPNDTKWEDYDEITLWKQCKLRGMEACVKKEGDALRALSKLKNANVEWFCYPYVVDAGGVRVSLPGKLVDEETFTSLVNHMNTQTIHVFHIEERHAPSSFESEMVIKMSDATVTIGRGKSCSCGIKVGAWSGSQTKIMAEEANIGIEQSSQLPLFVTPVLIFSVSICVSPLSINGY